jgi:phage tail sheath protein FI
MTADYPQRQCVNVWRLFIFLEEAIDHGTQFVVFESNDETIRAVMRLQADPPPGPCPTDTSASSGRL